MANHVLKNGYYSFDANDNPNDGPDTLLANNFDHDVRYNMENGWLFGLGEGRNGGNQIKFLKNFDNYYAAIPLISTSDKKHNVTGNDRANVIIGGSNDDHFYLSAGGDLLNGTSGIDTIDGSKLQRRLGITVDLRDEQTINTEDTIFNFENVVGTNKDDVLLGNDLDNRLEGGDGKDYIYGWGGNDTIVDKEGDGDIIAGLDGHQDVAQIGDAELTGTFSSPALLALLGIPAGDFLQFTRADGGIVNIHESTETITTDSDSRKWHQWYADAVQIPAPGAVNDGKAEFTIIGRNAVGETLTAKQTASDPDGDGTFIHTWEESASGNNWSSVGSGSTFLVESQHEGQQIRLKTEYTDAQGFAESIKSASFAVGSVDDGDAVFTITGRNTVGETLSAKQIASDPDGDGTFIHTWEGSASGNNWSSIGSGSTFLVESQHEGQQIRLKTEYTDAQGFAETIETESVKIGSINPVNRLYNTSTNKHLFSSNDREIDLLTESGWKDEGTIYLAPEEATAEVYRFYISSENRHFYTALESERDMIIGDQDTFSSWEYEGAAFSAYSTGDFPSDAIAVVRYLSQDTGSHVYSTSIYEQSLLNENSTWINEGIAWYGDPMVANTDLV